MVDNQLDEWGVVGHLLVADFIKSQGIMRPCGAVG